MYKRQAYGPGRLKEIGGICNNLDIKNPLIVTDKGSTKLPFIINLQNYLKSSDVKSDLFFDISPNPREDEVSNGVSKFKDGNHDAIIAIGGGSAMDGGKLICLTANNDVPLRDFEFELTPPKISKDNPFPKIITIPTTAGTGAETEISAMVTYLKEGMKFCMWHPDVRPSLALLDPELTIGLPANLTAWTGADALIHGIEGYCVPGFNPMCDGAALEGLSLISKSLVTAVEDPSNIVARGGMHVGSCLAGISFLKGLGLVHAIAHMVGAEYNTHHGLTNAVFMPYVLKRNKNVIEEKMISLSRYLNLADHSFDGIMSWILELREKLSIPHTLKDLINDDSNFKKMSVMAKEDPSTGGNPVELEVSDFEELYQNSFDGKL